MKLPLRSCLALGVLLLPSVAVAAPDGGVTARSERIRAQIDALLAARRRPPPLPIDPPNPFATATAGSAVPAARPGPPVGLAADPGPAAATNAEILARLASRLRIGGLIRLKDSVQIVVNDSPLREGDSFVAEREPRIVQLQVVRIQPGQLTVRLEEAELTVRF